MHWVVAPLSYQQTHFMIIIHLLLYSSSYTYTHVHARTGLPCLPATCLGKETVEFGNIEFDTIKI